jgi:hypothetical protein
MGSIEEMTGAWQKARSMSEGSPYPLLLRVGCIPCCCPLWVLVIVPLLLQRRLSKPPWLVTLSLPCVLKPWSTFENSLSMLLKLSNLELRGQHVWGPGSPDWSDWLPVRGHGSCFCVLVTAPLDNSQWPILCFHSHQMSHLFLNLIVFSLHDCMCGALQPNDLLFSFSA